MKKKILISILALAVAASSAVIFTGCGCNSDKKDQQATTVQSTTAAPTTQKTTRQDTTNRSAQSTTAQSNNSSSAQGDDLQTTALNAYGMSTANGAYAVQTGSTHNVEGTFDIVAVYDGNGNFVGNVYIHTSGYPVYAGQDVFESVHSGGNQVERGEENNNNNSQDNASSQSSYNNANNGDSPDDIYYGGANNQGGDGHDYADKGY